MLVVPVKIGHVKPMGFMEQSTPIHDPIRQRPHRKLRISVTDRCNFKCRYCVPEDAPTYLKRTEVLSFEEIAHFVRVGAIPLGINQLRLTGGEPLLRSDLTDLVHQLSMIKGIRTLSLTTNAALLDRYAKKLKEAGLQNLNISLDTLNEKTNLELTGTDHLRDVLGGIDAAMDQNFASIKLNCVPIRGINDHELSDILEFGRNRGIEVRFIEFMPFGSLWSPEHVITADDLCAILEPSTGPITRRTHRAGDTAQRFDLRSGDFFGVIPTHSQPFCGHCDRLRLTAKGTLLPCLFSTKGVDVRALIRDGAGALEIQEAVAQSLALKGVGFLEEQQRSERLGAMTLERDMRSIGG